MTPWAAGVCMIPYEICQLFRQCLFLVCSRTADMCNDRWKRIVFCSRLCWLVP